MTDAQLKLLLKIGEFLTDTNPLKPNFESGWLLESLHDAFIEARNEAP